ncbi:hypothetical protein [Pseudoxanthomonas sp. X-1]|uniref:hypothetical protein n=1 Tax=Pseudoxanthomonas sp. X-1 TaxID=2571115 RepID=UPI00110ABADD|nr:hypothetical protein [Pseudoxanthomonas sp. X-1]TMN19313.1 hypothetical protein FF950_12035 [Pseudoxanthomonas sp. X-1]UAY74171.1 hypothetical protein LAJ50_17135 [Pseudoxanthomonas sp. X-1]
MAAIIGAATAAFLLLSTASLFLPRRLLLADGDKVHPHLASNGAAAILAVFLLLLNASLWTSARHVHEILMVAGIFGAGRLIWLRASPRRVAVPGLIAILAVVLSGLIIARIFGASAWWLLEAANHDSIYYYEGALWSWNHPLRVGSPEVQDVWKLGNCLQGAVYIGNDCIGYRNGSYALLAVAAGRSKLGAANDVYILISLGVLLPMAAMWTWCAGSAVSSVRQLLMLIGAAIAANLVLFSPGVWGAVSNANLGTALGGLALSCVLGLAVSPLLTPVKRAVLLGIASSIVGHVYGEALAPACCITAIGVAADAFRARNFRHIFIGGAVSIIVISAGLNVVLFELYGSFKAISALAQGGQWAGWYLNTAPWAWVAAPFAGVLLGADPAVTQSQLAVGLFCSIAVVGASALVPRARFYVISLSLLILALVAYIELRHYAYGEHKIIQMVGPCAYMLALWTAVLCTYRGYRGGSASAVVRFCIGLLVLALLLFCAAAFAARSYHLLRDNIGLHGLSRDFEDGVASIGQRDTVLIDDSGAISVERFQKDHYAGFLIRMRGALIAMPDLRDNLLRGGYLRNIVSDSFASSGYPRWLLRLKSELGASSPFLYPDSSVSSFKEYDLVDLLRAPGASVAGNGWYDCELAHCWTHQQFEIESVARDECPAKVTLDVSYFMPPHDAQITITQEGKRESMPAKDGQLEFAIPAGWSRTVIQAGWNPISPKEAGLSSDDRKLFAKVARVRTTCVK